MSMEDNKVMIEVKGLKKQYRLGKIGPGSLQGTIKERRERRRSGVKATDYGKNKPFYALDGIDITIRKGEKVGIIGHNGAGKSTLLKILSRITAPTEGCVDIYGRVTSMLEVGTGFHGDMTGRENIYLNGAILGMSRSEIDAKMDDIIEFAEIGEFIDTPIKRYSSGMFVKLGFSVAFHLDSDIVIMDEVLAVGDITFQQKCLKALADTSRDDGRTVLYVSHNMSTVRQLCDRCIVLEKGKVVFDGDTDKAIGVYLGTKEYMPNEIVFGPDHKPDERYLRSVETFSMKRLKLLGRLDPIFRNTDEAQLQISYSSGKKIARLGFRFELWYQDGSKIATALSGNFIEVEPGEGTVNITVPLSHLQAGQYRADIIAFEFNGTPNERKLDAVYPGFIFQIEAVTDEKNYLSWQPKYYGSVRLDDMKLELV